MNSYCLWLWVAWNYEEIKEGGVDSLGNKHGFYITVREIHNILNLILNKRQIRQMDVIPACNLHVLPVYTCLFTEISLEVSNFPSFKIGF